MGTNFYFLTNSREKRDKWFGVDEYSLTDVPEWGYEIHIAKTSAGWKPLFQATRNIHSVDDIKKIYDDGGFKIIDEYRDHVYSWGEFEDRVIDFNRGNELAMDHLEYVRGQLEEMSDWKKLCYFNRDGSLIYFNDEKGNNLTYEVFV